MAILRVTGVALDPPGSAGGLAGADEALENSQLHMGGLPWEDEAIAQSSSSYDADPMKGTDAGGVVALGGSGVGLVPAPWHSLHCGASEMQTLEAELELLGKAGRLQAQDAVMLRRGPALHGGAGLGSPRSPAIQSTGSRSGSGSRSGLVGEFVFLLDVSAVP